MDNFEPSAPPENTTTPVRTRPPHIRYSILDGFFVPSESGFPSDGFDYRRSMKTYTILGLKNRGYDTDHNINNGQNFRYANLQWPRFTDFVMRTKENMPEDVDYKILILGRHGEGFHNVAEAKYGTDLWDEYWSRHDNFSDPHLTPKGYVQAQAASEFWQSAMKFQRVPTPQSYYISPLTRCLSTAMLTYSSLELPKDRPFHATIKENLRETIGIHTCDRRSTLTYISQHFSGLTIEPGFTETDELWTDSHRETPEELATRVKLLIDDIFNHDNATFISMTTHSGFIQALLDVVGHRRFEVPPGGLLPVFVKAEWYGNGTGSVGEQGDSLVPVEYQEQSHEDEQIDARIVGEKVDQQ